MQIILTIAGFDPSSGAGVSADLAVFAAHRYFGIACITALTVQTTVEVRATHAVDSEVVTATLNALQLDLPPAAIKIGMLATEQNVLSVVHFLTRLRQAEVIVPVVLDPVIQSSSGHPLLDDAGVQALREQLLPLVDWVTPNLDELATLVQRPPAHPPRVDGEDGRAEQQRPNQARSKSEQERSKPEHARLEMERASAVLLAQYPSLNIIATGGHLPSASDLVVLADGQSAWLEAEKIASRATHGTGCAFASSLACGLAGGLDGFAAARQAKRYVAEAIRTAEPLGQGYGPMNLLWPLTLHHGVGIT